MGREPESIVVRLDEFAELTDVHGTKTLKESTLKFFISLKLCYTHVKKI